MFDNVPSGRLCRGRPLEHPDEEFPPMGVGTARLDQFPLTGGWNRGTGLDPPTPPAVPSAEGVPLCLNIVDPPADTSPP